MKLSSLRMLTATAVVFLVTSTAWAADFEGYSDAALAEAQKSGSVILLDFHAAWCPTCRAQRDWMINLSVRY